LNHPSGLRGHDDYRVLADAIPQIIWSSHADGSIEYFNRAWYRYTGLSDCDSLDDGWVNTVHPDDRESVVAHWLRTIASSDVYEVEVRLRAADGTYRWFVGRARAVREANGSIVKWYGGCTDIDDLKNAEASMREHATTFQKLANSLPQMVWITNAAGENTYLNHRWYDYTGIDPSRPHELREAAHPDDHEYIFATWARAREAGTTFECEFRIRRADGAYRWFLVRAVPVHAADGAIVEWFGTCTDIEDKKRFETEVVSAYERERRVATTLQRAFLTQTLPLVEGFAFDAVYRPSEREAAIGGDWYDAFALDDERIVVSIGDVAGHGLDAAVVMGNVRQAIRVVARVVEPDPTVMLDAVDRTLRRDSPNTMVTAFIGIIDTRARTLTFASAGHPPPLMFARDEISELSHRGLPLGLRDAAASLSATTVALPDAGMIVLYTDGLIESTRDTDEGERRLAEALAKVAESRAEFPAEEIQRLVVREGANDDVAVLTLRFYSRETVDLASATTRSAPAPFASRPTILNA
jgi:PAS domain S-box-containing protein